MSARTGLSVEALSALGHAATQSGTDMETVEGAVRRMQKALLAGSEENLQAAGTFATLGLSVAKLARLSPEQQFAVIAKAIARIPSPTFKAAAAMQVFGKSGTALLPMIGELGALTQEAKDFGLVWTGDEAKQADALGDALDLLSKVGKRVFEVIGSAIAPVLTDLAMRLARAGKMAMDWVADNKELVVLAFKIGAGVIVAGAALVVLGTAIAGLGLVLGKVAVGLKLVGVLIGFLTSPIALVVAGLAGLTAWLLTSTDAGGQALAWLGERFGELKDDALAAFKGISNALVAGDIALAGRILWATLRVEWLKGTAALAAIWADWGVATMDVFSGVVHNIASHMIDFWAAIKSIWAVAMADLSGSWGDLVAGMIRVFLPLADVIAQVFGMDIQKAVDDALASIGVGPGGDAAAAARQKALGDQLGGIEADRQQQQQAINDQELAAGDARRKAANEQLAAAQAELAQARAQFADLNAQAGKEAAAAGKGRKGPRLFTPEGLDLGLQGAAQKVETKGTFAAAALRGLGVGDTAGDQLKEQKKTNDHLRQLNDRARRGQIVFNEP
jgi:hypothetical protein